MYDVVGPDGYAARDVETVEEAQAVAGGLARAQVQKRAKKVKVPAAFAVFVDGVQVGEPETDATIAARRAKKEGGEIRLVAA